PRTGAGRASTALGASSARLTALAMKRKVTCPRTKRPSGTPRSSTWFGSAMPNASGSLRPVLEAVDHLLLQQCPQRPDADEQGIKGNAYGQEEANEVEHVPEVEGGRRRVGPEDQHDQPPAGEKWRPAA